jgi:hypothetical protein
MIRVGANLTLELDRGMWLIVASLGLYQVGASQWSVVVARPAPRLWPAGHRSAGYEIVASGPSVTSITTPAAYRPYLPPHHALES